MHMLIRRPGATHHYSEHGIDTYDIHALIQTRERLYDEFPAVDRTGEKAWEQPVTMDEIETNLRTYLTFHRNHTDTDDATLEIISPICEDRFYFRRSKCVGLTMTYMATVSVQGGQWFVDGISQAV